MLVTTRLTLAWTLAGLLVFGGYGIWLVQRERADLFRSAERELWLLGTTVQVAVENALRDGQLEDASETIAEIEGIDASVDVAVFDRTGRLLLTTGPGATDVSPVELPANDLREVRLVGEGEPVRMIFVSTLYEPGSERFGTLVLARPLAELDADLAATVGTVTLTVGLFVVTSGAMGWSLGRVYIGRPLGSLARAMRQVRGGELRPVLEASRSDEIGAVAAEFDRMMADLAAARASLVAASEARQDLERALQHADKLATVGQISATVAHEIGSPLQVLRGRAQALLRDPADAARVERHATILVRETDRIARIVEQLLAMTRPRAVRRGPLDLVPLIRQTVELYELEAKRRSVRVTTRLPTDAPFVGEADRLQQVVVNLLANALTATPRGGTVALELVRTALGFELAVRDDGIGVSAEVAARAFEPFFTTRAESGGTGLGLAVVKGIAEEHGGRVEFVSALGHGTVVRVQLPTQEST